MSWHDAKAYCESLGGYLATITSQEENDFIYSNLANNSPQVSWLGATDEEEEGVWKWVTGETWSYTNWYSGEPNNWCEEDYLHFTDGDNLWASATKSNRWNDLQTRDNGGSMCGGSVISMSTICEWDNVVIPTPTPSPSPSPSITTAPKPTPTPTLSPGEGSIYGFVKDEDELPLKNVLMTLTGPDAGSTKTDEDGYYNFEELSAGDYTLEASKSGYQTHTEDLTLGEGEELEVETIYLEETPCGSIYGFVVNINGDPVENARLKLRGLRKVKHIKCRTASDKDGFFEFSEDNCKCLEEGKYVITVNKRRHRPAQKTVEIEEGEEKDIEIVLRKKSHKIKMLFEEEAE